MLAVILWTVRFSGGVPLLSSRIKNLVNGFRVPCHNILLLYIINHCSLSYDTLKPELHNISMKTKDVWANPGTTCAHVSDLGIHGRSKLPMCVDYNVFPSGKFMNSGRVDG